MDSAQILQLLLSGLTSGSIYALIALGLTIILNSTDVINVAQGEIVVLGGVLTVTFVNGLGLPLPLGIAAAVAAVGIVGGGIYLIAIDPIRQSPAMTLVMVTLAVSMMMSSSAGLIWGYDPMRVATASVDKPIDLFGAAIVPQAIWIFIIAAVTMIALHQFYNRTRLGRAMLACNVDQELALLAGINARRMVLGSFVVGAGFAGLAGALITPLTSISVYIGLSYTLKGFAAAVFGGLGKSSGAVIGGLAIGLMESFGGGLVSTGYRDFLALLVILVVLIFRPSGLLGSRLSG
jgi:branched-chain amino acid transport system permease protein